MIPLLHDRGTAQIAAFFERVQASLDRKRAAGRSATPSTPRAAVMPAHVAAKVSAAAEARRLTALWSWAKGYTNERPAEVAPLVSPTAAAARAFIANLDRAKGRAPVAERHITDRRKDS